MVRRESFSPVVDRWRAGCPATCERLTRGMRLAIDIDLLSYLDPTVPVSRGWVVHERVAATSPVEMQSCWLVS
jgi:hypothetical protein